MTLMGWCVVKPELIMLIKINSLRNWIEEEQLAPGYSHTIINHLNVLFKLIYNSSVTPISVVSSIPQEQNEMNSEDMNLLKFDPVL